MKVKGAKPQPVCRLENYTASQVRHYSSWSQLLKGKHGGRAPHPPASSAGAQAPHHVLGAPRDVLPPSVTATRPFVIAPSWHSLATPMSRIFSKLYFSTAQ